MADIPIYVTRPKANGDVGYFTISPGVGLTIWMLIIANVFGWSVFGLVTLVEKVVESVG